MPYASQDRQEFIKRTYLKQDARVLDFGGTLSGELHGTICALTSPKHVANSVLIKPDRLPFKDSTFGAVVSYHYFDLVPSDMQSHVFGEIARVLNKEAVFSFMILLWAPQNEAQRSSLLFSELLKSTGTLYSHDFEDISRRLSSHGFSEITVETVKREIKVPRDFIRIHLLMLGELLKKEKEEGGTGIKTLARQYFAQVSGHGEAMLPALHFTARRL